ncbi:unnamed protein product [Colletotrichum noveboracense]|uniref:Uncharacterized protein n=1 Tax=Colletotrichum noveboracense TaxID=2664923 RepID=A0A9W4W7D9_9PEZI|nr:unnamed protein product [Colletotrichum noveboracense]
MDKITAWIYATTDAALRGRRCVGKPDSRTCSSCDSRFPFSADLFRLQDGNPVCPRCKHSGNIIQLNTPTSAVPSYMCSGLVFGSLVQEANRIIGKDFALMKEPKPHFKQSIDHFSRLIATMSIYLPSEHKACNPLPACRKTSDSSSFSGDGTAFGVYEEPSEEDWHRLKFGN